MKNQIKDLNLHFANECISTEERLRDVEDKINEIIEFINYNGKEIIKENNM